MHHPTSRITHTTAFVTPVVEHGLERKITLLPRSYISLLRQDITYITVKFVLVDSGKLKNEIAQDNIMEISIGH